ncbi:MAG: ATP-binding cassette domain-containing protein [Bacteroidales bacterium]|nr:ATP-binding cassette domain-containing protein [Bacteroidales bacterium]
MSEPILKALMQLFALIVDVDESKEISDRGKTIVRSFLARQLNNELVERYMKVFEEYLSLYHQDDITRGSIRDRKRTSLTAVRILGICEKINEELEQKQKIYVIIQLIEYIAYGIEIREKELDFLQTVASSFNIQEEEYQNILGFVAYSLKDTPHKKNVLLINNEDQSGSQDVKHIFDRNLLGEISFLNIVSVNTYILRYHGKDDLFLNGQHIHSGLTYTFEHGSSIRGQSIDPIYYTDVTETFSKSSSASNLSFVAQNVEFKFKNSENGLQEFNFHEESGKLVGIMGGSGVGKSTLLNVLNGNLKPQQGKILINGHDLNSEKEKEFLNGVIGFIPQDDLLIEDLTVYQNLYYNARLCLNDYEEEQLKEIVQQVLIDLDLYEIRDLKVGKPLNKVISGGQRKRVNIGLELIREPSVLFVDEPTSGLSSLDSEMVMNLLKEQVYKGKLVIVNIHQPSSNLYKMFDKIIFLDKGGFQIYYGNPSEAVVYFKTKSNHANAKEDQCIKCGNVDPDQVLQIIEAKIVNEHGKLSHTRKVSPKEWFNHFKSSTDQKPEEKVVKGDLPENYYSLPGLFKQLNIFLTRDVKSKLTNRQYILISLLEAPLLAMILGYFTKYFSGTFGNPDAYVFRNNENLPAYLLMSVIVFLFLGLTISSEEIIKDRKILQRESFLNLSRFSYLNSKILIMFMISAVQTILFVLIGNFIFEIKGMTFSYWMILFTTSCFANMLGLNISSGLNSVITIYILVPFLLIPQLLFSGVMVKFDKLHRSLTNYEYVPVIGDLMTSRWAYEALAVEQFKNNKYQREFFPLDQEISNSRYLESFLIPTLQGKLDESVRSLNTNGNRAQTLMNLTMLQDQIENLNIESFNESYAEDIKAYLQKLKDNAHEKTKVVSRERKLLQEQLIDQLGGLKSFTSFRNEHDNSKLSDILLNRHELVKIVEKDHLLIRKYEPVFMEPTSNLGRAHLYAPVKIIGGLKIDTPWFNVIIIWITSMMLYMTLYFDVIRKVLAYQPSVLSRLMQHSFQ